MERSQFPIPTMARELAQAVMAHWTRANAELCPPIFSAEDTIAQGIKKEWNTMSDIAWRRETKAKKIKIFEDKLGKLFDIAKCKCKINSCDELGCIEGCNEAVHISCSCPCDLKLPREKK